MEKNEIQLDEFIKLVKPDAKEESQFDFIAGYVGQSPVEDHVRIYFDASLNASVDVPKSAIAYSVKNSKEENRLGGSIIWLKRDRWRNKSQATSSGSYLEGELYNHYANQMYQPGQGHGQPYPTTTIYNKTHVEFCAPSIALCPTIAACRVTSPQFCEFYPTKEFTVPVTQTWHRNAAITNDCPWPTWSGNEGPGFRRNFGNFSPYIP